MVTHAVVPGLEGIDRFTLVFLIGKIGNLLLPEISAVPFHLWD